MEKRIKVKSRFVYKSKTNEEWQNENPVLLKGEIGFVTDGKDGNFVKVGDGTSDWNNLQFKKNVDINDLKNLFATKVQLQEVSDLVNQKADLTDCIKNTDYATGDKAGVVKVDASDNGQGGLVMNDFGEIVLTHTSEDDIENKAAYDFPITTRLLDKAVKTGITTNTIPLTAEEKKAARDWMGIKEVITNVDIETERINRYAVPETIPERDSNGSVNVAIAIKDENGNNYIGAAVPHTLMNKRFSDTNTWVQNASATATAANDRAIEAKNKVEEITADLDSLEGLISSLLPTIEKSDNKKIKFNWQQSIELKTSSLYLLRAAGKDVIRIYKQDGTEMSDSDGGILRPAKTFGGNYDGSRYMLLVIPENITADYYGCFAIGVPESYTNLMAKSFYWYPNTDGQITAATTDGSGITIWEIKL